MPASWCRYAVDKEISIIVPAEVKLIESGIFVSGRLTAGGLKNRNRRRRAEALASNSQISGYWVHRAADRIPGWTSECTQALFTAMCVFKNFCIASVHDKYITALVDAHTSWKIKAL